MRETLDPWPFVIAAYALTIGGTLLLTAWAMWSMRRAEARRERIRER
jgi:hypothetical protein